MLLGYRLADPLALVVVPPISSVCAVNTVGMKNWGDICAIGTNKAANRGVRCTDAMQCLIYILCSLYRTVYQCRREALP